MHSTESVFHEIDIPFYCKSKQNNVSIDIRIIKIKISFTKLSYIENIFDTRERTGFI